MPEHLVDSGGLPLPDPEGDVIRLAGGQVCSASHDGLLLLRTQDIRFTAPIIAKQGGHKVRQPTGLAHPDHNPDMTHYVFNPLTREVSPRLPEIQGPKKILGGFHLGLVTQADAGRGPPDRYAVAELEGPLMIRFLSETGEWEIVECSPHHLPVPAAPRRFEITQEVVAFRGHLWWVDVTWGAIAADPFSERPEPHFAELPSGSVLPADAHDEAFRRGSQLPDANGNVWWMEAPAMYRRVGVSGGWLRYVEVSEEEPFVLSSFALDGRGWKLVHRVALSPLWADGDYPWLPLQGNTRPKIGVLHPFQANVVHLIVGKHVVVVDIRKGKVIQYCPRIGDICILPCPLSPWLPTTRLPSIGESLNCSFIC
jgi:hypothetical protein